MLLRWRGNGAWQLRKQGRQKTIENKNRLSQNNNGKSSRSNILEKLSIYQKNNVDQVLLIYIHTQPKFYTTTTTSSCLVAVTPFPPAVSVTRPKGLFTLLSTCKLYKKVNYEVKKSPRNRSVGATIFTRSQPSLSRVANLFSCT